MADETQPQPKDVKEVVEPAAAPVDGKPPIASSRPIEAGEKPQLAPEFEQEKPKPAETTKPEPEPSEPPSKPPPEDND